MDLSSTRSRRPSRIGSLQSNALSISSLVKCQMVPRTTDENGVELDRQKGSSEIKGASKPNTILL